MRVDPQELRRIAGEIVSVGEYSPTGLAAWLHSAAYEIERLKRRETDLLEANNRYLERARKAEQAGTKPPSAEHVAAFIYPDLFSSDGHVSHRAASPMNVNHARAKAIADVARVLSAAAQGEPQS